MLISIAIRCDADTFDPHGKIFGGDYKIDLCCTADDLADNAGHAERIKNGLSVMVDSIVADIQLQRIADGIDR